VGGGGGGGVFCMLNARELFNANSEKQLLACLSA